MNVDGAPILVVILACRIRAMATAEATTRPWPCCLGVLAHRSGAGGGGCSGNEAFEGQAFLLSKFWI